MLYTAKVSPEAPVQLKSKSARTLVITNVSLAEESNTACLYLGQSDSEERVLIVELQKATFPAFHTEIRIMLSQGRGEVLSCAFGDVHVIGYYLQEVEKDNHSSHPRVNQHPSRVEVPKQAEEKTKLTPSRNDKEETRVSRPRRVTNKEESTKPKPQEKPAKPAKKGSASKGKSLLEMMQNLSDSEDDEESDYSEQSESSSSQSSSSSDEKESPSRGKKESKQLKIKEKEIPPSISQLQNQQTEQLPPSQPQALPSPSEQKPFQYRIPQSLPEFLLKK